VEIFVRKLSEGIGSIGVALYPPVIVRLGDFKSNKYRRLIGGKGFEPNEENPMIGLRGASRYLHADFKDAFELVRTATVVWFFSVVRHPATNRIMSRFSLRKALIQFL
jgi:phosphoenolpyruvate synthase/pyruvate phosphate dikinase